MEILIIIILSIVIVLLSIALVLSKKSNKTDTLSKELADMLKQTREELSNIIGSKIVESTNIQQNSLTNLTSLNETKLENIRKSVEEKLEALQKDNSEKLEKMRMTVDEKLQSTLERRLGESFKLVNDRLESVYKGLGEMQGLAQGVGDLKKVFTNVKARGYWGEVQLSAILEQFLTPEQYATNIVTKAKSREFVEFAIKLPGKNGIDIVYLPVDSKFPIEDYTRLVEAQEQCDIPKITECTKKLENEIKLCAKDIYEKYIDPPYTTDFGIMFLPTESLYCEVIKNTNLCETLTQKYRVLITGPSTFLALINSLQMGFKTLAIEKRSSEVWELLGIVKKEFGKFGDLLEQTNKKLLAVTNTMSMATRKTRTIEKKLKNVEALPIADEEAFYGKLDEETDQDYDMDNVSENEDME